jgi:hypothetical protein
MEDEIVYVEAGNAVRRESLQSLTELWKTCGQHEGKWIRDLFSRQVLRIGQGERVHGWPFRKEEIEFVREHVSGKSLPRGRLLYCAEW